MTDAVLIFTRPDGIKVHIIKSMMVSWSPEIGSAGTRINLLNGFQTVKETPQEILALWSSDG